MSQYIENEFVPSWKKFAMLQILDGNCKYKSIYQELTRVKYFEQAMKLLSVLPLRDIEKWQEFLQNQESGLKTNESKKVALKTQFIRLHKELEKGRFTFSYPDDWCSITWTVCKDIKTCTPIKQRLCRMNIK